MTAGIERTRDASGATRTGVGSSGAATATTSAPAFDTAMCRLLRVPSGPCTATDDQAHRLFSTSMAISAARCLLTYIVLPILSPLLGPATGDHPAIGIPLGIVAIVFDIRAVRRFWLAEHPWRRRITGVYAVVLIMIFVLLAININQLA